ncbi:hypothetical protein GF354_05225 [Candidatus Peregrinibacteria bacterium]|nr:hypothetical protein [Candidatus Peregrinibacteria bacterium]
MHIKKVIKFYLYLILIISTFALLNYNPNFNQYFTSVVHSIDEWGKKYDIDPYTFVGRVEPPVDYDLMQWQEKGDFFISDQDKADGIHFEIFSKDAGSFALPGDRNAYVMTFRIKAFDEPIRLSSLTITPQSSHIDDIPYVSIKSGDKVIPYTEMIDGAFVFKGLNINIPENSQKELHLFADVSPYLNTGDRIRFDILSPEHIKLEKGSSPYSLKHYYPINGEYLTIVGVRHKITEKSET